MFPSNIPRLLTEPAGIGHVRFEAEPTAPLIEESRALLDYCARRRKAGLLARADFRPADVPRLLPNLFIAEPVPEDDLRYRLAGTEIVWRLGVEPTGMSVRKIFEPETAGRILRCYAAMRDGAEPMVWRARYFGLGRDYVLTEVVNVPMLGRDGRTVHLLGAVFFPRS